MQGYCDTATQDRMSHTTCYNQKESYYMVDTLSVLYHYCDKMTLQVIASQFEWDGNEKIEWKRHFYNQIVISTGNVGIMGSWMNSVLLWPVFCKKKIQPTALLKKTTQNTFVWEVKNIYWGERGWCKLFLGMNLKPLLKGNQILWDSCRFK